MDVNLTVKALIDACYATDSESQKRVKETLEACEQQSNYIPLLIYCVKNVEEQLCQRVRLLSAIMLKNYVSKRISDKNQREELTDTAELICQFLSSHIEVVEPKVAMQLDLIAANLAKFLFPSRWPDLMVHLTTTLGSKDNLILQVHAANRILEVLTTLSGRVNCSHFRPVLEELCFGLFKITATTWSKAIMNIHEIIKSKVTALDAYSSNGQALSSHRSIPEELTFHLATTTSLILKIILEVSTVVIATKSSCLQCFWKTYLTGLNILVMFTRKMRHTYHELFNVNTIPPSATSYPTDWLFLRDEEKDSDLNSVDSFDPRYLNAESGSSGIYAAVHLSSRLLLAMNCTPVILFRKHTQMMMPYAKSFSTFYYRFLLDEYQAGDIPIPQPVNNPLPIKMLPLAACLYLSHLLDLKITKTASAVSTVVGEQVENEECPVEALLLSSPDRVNALLKIIVFRLLPWDMTTCHEGELLTWVEEPEIFFLQQQLDSSENNQTTLRTAAQRLLTLLLELCPEQTSNFILQPLLQELSQQIAVLSASQCMSLDCQIEGIQRYDGLYSALITCPNVFLTTTASTQGGGSDKGRYTVFLQEILGPLFTAMSPASCALNPTAHTNNNNTTVNTTFLPNKSDHGNSVLTPRKVLQSRLLQLLSTWMNYFDSHVHSSILSYLLCSLTSCSSSSDEFDLVVCLHTIRAVECILMSPGLNKMMLQPFIMTSGYILIDILSQLMEFEVQQWVCTVICELFQLCQNSTLNCDLQPIISRLLHLFHTRFITHTILHRSFLETLKNGLLTCTINIYGSEMEKSIFRSVLQVYNLTRNHENTRQESLELLLVTLQNTSFHSPHQQTAAEENESVLLFQFILETLNSYFTTSNTEQNEPELVQFCLQTLTCVSVLLIQSDYQPLLNHTCNAQFQSLCAHLITHTNTKIRLQTTKLLVSCFQLWPEKFVEFVVGMVGFMENVFRTVFALSPCANLSGLLSAFSNEESALQVEFLTLIALFLVYHPQSVAQGLSTLKTEIMAVVSKMGLPLCNSLSETILIEQLLHIYSRALPVMIKQEKDSLIVKLWLIALWSLLPGHFPIPRLALSSLQSQFLAHSSIQYHHHYPCEGQGQQQQDWSWRNVVPMEKALIWCPILMKMTGMLLEQWQQAISTSNTNNSSSCSLLETKIVNKLTSQLFLTDDNNNNDDDDDDTEQQQDLNGAQLEQYTNIDFLLQQLVCIENGHSNICSQLIQTWSHPRCQVTEVDPDNNSHPLVVIKESIMSGYYRQVYLEQWMKVKLDGIVRVKLATLQLAVNVNINK